jgi:hypothetical protein
MSESNERSGPIMLDSPEGRGEDEPWYACHYCDPTGTYRMYPLSMMVERDGIKYCRVHYNWRFNKKDSEATRLEFTDERD